MVDTYHWDVIGCFIWDLFETSWRRTTETSWRRSTETSLGVSFETYLRRHWDVQRDVVTTLLRRLVAGWVIMNIIVTDRQVQYTSKRAKNGTYKNVNESPLKFVCDFASTRLHKTRLWLINDQVSAYVHLLTKLKNRNCKAKPTCCWYKVWTQRCLCTTQYHQRETLHFAIENIVFENDTPGGKNEFHQTAQMILQKRVESTR